jgi:calcium permeable stress-gated cation channel
MALRRSVSLRGFLVIFDLAQVVNLLWVSFKTRYVDAIDFSIACSRSVGIISILGRTPRDYREYTQPPEFEYAIY